MNQGLDLLDDLFIYIHSPIGCLCSQYKSLLYRYFYPLIDFVVFITLLVYCFFYYFTMKLLNS